MIDPENLSEPRLPKDEAGDYIEEAIGEGSIEPEGRVYDMHFHRRAQLFHIQRGSLRLTTAAGSYLVPPERAIWVPSNVPHAVTYLQDTSLRYLFFRPDVVENLPATVSVIGVTPLMRELIAAFMRYPRSAAGSESARRIVGVLLDQLQISPIVPLHLPLPETRSLARLASRLRNEPAMDLQLAEVAKDTAMSERTFQRRFQSETGMTFRAWRHQAKLIKAAELLASGRSVSDTAFELGYSGPSAFIAVFRDAFGISPGRYFEGPQP